MFPVILKPVHQLILTKALKAFIKPFKANKEVCENKNLS